jgi:hypothetical protein
MALFVIVLLGLLVLFGLRRLFGDSPKKSI